MNPGDKILLWPDEVPYTSDSPDQAQPSLTAFPVPHSRGAVIVCPGGAYLGKASYEGDPIARMLNSAGISSFVLDYRVAPCHHEAPLSDASRAIRMLRYLGYQRIGILGFSAGGHLCCSAATLYTSGNSSADDPVERLSSRPDVFIPCYPVATMGTHTHLGTRKNLLGFQEKDTELMRRFSAEENITPNTPPAFIWHTSADELVSVQNSLHLASALAKQQIPFEMHIYPDGAHGLGLGAEQASAATWGSACSLWLLKQGFGV